MDNLEGLRQTARQGAEGGFSLIPINPLNKKPLWRLLPELRKDGQPVMRDGKFGPYRARGWEPYQSERASLYTITGWISEGAQLAVVCGAISIGLLILDFDEPGFFWRWRCACARAGVPVEHLTIQRTGGGGWQVLLGCANPGENQKLAWVKDASQKSGRSVAIETRGEGGYAIIAPSLHPSGNLYAWRQGDLSWVYEWDMDCVNAMLDTARSLNQVMDEPPPVYKPRGDRGASSGPSVIDAYNARTDIQDILSKYGYTPAHADRWHRPGNDTTSEPSVQFKDNKSWHWSSNDPLSNGYWKTPFAVRLFYDFHGDLSKAVKEISAELDMDYMKYARMYRAKLASAIPMRSR